VTIPPDDPFKDGELPINLPVTRAINDINPENKVEKARLIVIKNSIVANNKTFKIEDGYLSHLDSVFVLDTIPVGKVDMFIIVNEKAEWGLDAIAKRSIYFPEDIEKKTLTFSTYPVVSTANPIPMYKQYRDLYVTSQPATFTLQNGTPIEMDSLGVVDRLYAKVTLIISAKFSEMVNGGDPILLDSVFIKSIPKHSYLTPSHGLLYPASGGYFNGAETPRHINYASTDSLRDTLTWYIPEHRLSDPAYMTSIYVKASLAENNEVDEQVAFDPIVLGDGMASHSQAEMRSGGNMPITNWFITRNTHYTVNARIKSFSKTNESEMIIRTNILTWNETPIDEKVIWQYDLDVSQDIFYIPSAGNFEGTVMIETNHPEGWNVSGSAGLTFSNGSSTYAPDLSNQMGTLLKFRYAGTGDGSIDVKAGLLSKHIKIVRTP
jgi:hypothetical protein